MGRIEDKQHDHLLYGISICMAYLSHESINKKNFKNHIRVNSSIPCTIRYTRVIVNKLPSIFMRIDVRGAKKPNSNSRIFFRLNYSIFIKKLESIILLAEVYILIQHQKSILIGPKCILLLAHGWLWTNVAWTVTLPTAFTAENLTCKSRNPPHQNKGKCHILRKKANALFKETVLYNKGTAEEWW